MRASDLPRDRSTTRQPSRTSPALAWPLRLMACLSSIPLAATAARAEVFASVAPAALGTSLGEKDRTATMRIIVALPLRDQAGAESFARDVQDPASADYRKFLTPAEFGARFGASADDYAALRQWAVGRGLTVGPASSSRTTLSLQGTVAQIEALFSTRIGQFRTSEGEDAFAPTVAPALPAALTGRVSAIIGLSSAKRFAPLVRAAPKTAQTAGGSGVLGAYDPADFHTAYNIVKLVTPAPTTETAAVFEQGGFTPSDITKFEKQYHLPATPITVREVDGVIDPATNAGVELESVTDLDTLIGINPQIQQILDYEDATDPFAVGLLNALSLMAEDDVAQTISISYGSSEVLQGNAALQAEAAVLTQLTAQGQAVFASSGDEGAQGQIGLDGNNVLDPASQPAVTGVGGTTLFTGTNSVYEAETAWGLLNESLGASGGGVSSFWSIPDYQIEQINPGEFQSVALANGGSATFRNVPDLAADGDPLTGASVYSAINGGWQQVGGTSLSAPLWAAVYSIMNEASKAIGLGAIGNFAATNYRIAEDNGLFFGYNDILSGTNGQSTLGMTGFTAGRGFDNVTGWGSLNGANLLVGEFASVARVGLHPSAVSKVTVSTTSTSAGLSWSAGAGATGYFIQTSLLNTSTTVQEAATQSLSAEITGLQPGTEYIATILSVNANGVASQDVTFKTKGKS